VYRSSAGVLEYMNSTGVELVQVYRSSTVLLQGYRVVQWYWASAGFHV
jgi:hypothetical protein